MSKSRASGVLKWTGFAMLALITLGGIGVELAARREEARVAKRVAAIRASGAPTTAVELGLPRVPDAENAAPIYEKAFAALSFGEGDEDLIANVGAGKADLGDPAVRERVRTILDGNLEALGLIEQASRLPECQFPVKWERGVNALFPHLPNLRKCQRLVGAQAAFLAASGEAQEALGECGVAVRLAEALRDEPQLVGQLARYALVHMACASLEATLDRCDPTPADCGRLAQQIAEIDLTTGLVRALEGERAMSLSMFSDFRGGRYPRGSGGSGQPSPGQAPPAGGRLLRTSGPFRLWLALNALSYLDVADRTLELARMPWREARTARPSPKEILGRKGARERMTTVFASILVSVGGTTTMARDRAAAALSATRVGLLLKAYRAKRGGYPNSLEEVGRERGGALPEDPFTGKPLIYRRKGEGFIVYSIGPNLKDDGGVGYGRNRTTDDIVFECSR